MGSPDNITEETLKKMAGKKDLTEFKKQLLIDLERGKPSSAVEKALENAAKAWGQSLEEAKKNTLALLRSQVG